MNEQRRARLIAYGVAVLATAVTFVVRLLLWPVLGDAVPHMAFFPAVMIAAYYGGFWPGSLATVLGAVVANVVFTEPHFTLGFKSVNAVVALPLFVLVGLFISGLTESLHGSYRRLATQRRQEEEAQAFRRANQRMELALRGSNIGVWDIEMRDGDYLHGPRHYVNVWELLGYEGPAPGWETTLDAIHPDDRVRVKDAVRQYLAGETTEYETEARFRHRDGSYHILLARAVAVRDAGGKPIRFVGVAIDITQLKHAEEELRRTSALLQGFVDGTQDAVYVKDLEGRHLMFNAAASRMVGKPIADVLGRDDTAIFDPDSAREVMAHDRQVMESGVATTKEHELSAGGVTRTYLSSKAPYRDGQGNVIGLIGLCHDITGRKRAEEALRESEQRWRSLAEALPQLVWTDTPDGYCDYLSTQWEKYTGVPATEHLGWGWMEALHPNDRERAQFCWTEAVAGRADYDVEFRIRRADGEYRWFKVRGLPVRDSAGTIVKWFGTCTDITDLRQTQEALRQAKARLDLAVRGSNIVIWECNMPDGRIENSTLTYTNVWESMGYDAATAPTDFPATSAILFHPIDRERVVREIQELFASDRQDYESEFRARWQDGSTRWHLSRGAVLRDPEGKPVRFIGTSADITDIKRAEEALRESEQRWRSLTEALPQLVWSATPDGTCDYFSAQWTEHTGIAEVDLLGWQWLQTLHPDDREPTRRFWLDSVAGHHSYDIEYRVRRRDGEYRWFKTRGVPIRDTGGNIVKWFGTCTDITELRQSEARFRGTFENAAVGIAHTHPTGRFLRVNETFCTILGYPREELLQKGFQDITHPDDLAGNINLLEGLIRGDSPGYTTEKRYLRKDGSPIWAELFASLQRDAAGNPAYAIGVIQDISERKRLDTELRQAKEAAETANRAKDDFLANVSHEIRTPMNAILGMTELVLDTPLDEGQRQGLKTVKSAADSLLGIINDLLDFSKIEAGKLELIVADFSLRGAVGDTLRALAVRAHKKGLELIYQVQPDVPDALIGDAGRLRQVLLNLVGNAVKFTDEGEVVVTVGLQIADCGLQIERQQEQPAGDASAPSNLQSAICNLQFTVRDTGIGIPAEQQERIFRAFEQEDTSTTRKYSGTGLGLTIASRLVALMGGTINVDSVPGRGSTFAFTARFGRQAHPSESVPTPPTVLLHELPVLIVDDNATNRHILSEWLRGWQMSPTAVADGMAAMDALWHRAANGRPYALVLLDARMPDADGLAVAAMIRERAELAATRIILLTSGERPGDPARFRELRIDAQLLKPVQQDELLETIFRVLRKDEGRRTKDEKDRPSASASSFILHPSSLPLHILVAEDNELSAQVLEQSLVRQGHRVRLASNGREVLKLAEQGGFDLLLLDVHMPELDGFQVVQAVRERELTTGEHLPIIALTARSGKEDRERCLAAGMDDFQTKPIRPADLLAAIDRVLKTRSQETGVRSQTARFLTPDSCLLTPGLLDAPVLLAACGGDPTLLGKMCQTLIARVPEHLAALRDALRDQDAPRLREAAHKCCGMLSEFSAAAGDLAGTLEDLAAATHLEKAAPILDQLETIAHELVKQTDGMTVEALRRQAERMDEPNGTAGP